MELTQQRAHTSPAQVVAAAAAVVVVGVVAFLGGRASTGPDDPFEATVVKISSDADSLCVDRDEDSCGFPIINPEDRDRVVEGARVLVTEIELDTDGGSILAFYVRMAD